MKPTPEVNPVTTVDPVATVPDYNPWRWEAVCDPKSDSFIVLPGFLINWMGIRNTVDTMNDMAIYHNYHDYSNGGTTVDSNGYSQQLFYYLFGTNSITTVANDLSIGLSKNQLDCIKTENPKTFTLYSGNHSAKCTDGSIFNIDIANGHSFAVKSYDEEKELWFR